MNNRSTYNASAPQFKVRNYGKNGYPEMTPGRMWLATTVWTRSITRETSPSFLFLGRVFHRLGKIHHYFLCARDWFYRRGERQFGAAYPSSNDIYPSFADTRFHFRTKENSPWLSSSQVATINAYYTKDNVHRRSVMTQYDFAYWNQIYSNSDTVLRQEKVLKRRFEKPEAAFEVEEGGWLPNGANLVDGSQIAQDLVHRQLARAVGDIALADLIRRVVTGGSVEVQDLPDGTLWFFAPQLKIVDTSIHNK